MKDFIFNMLLARLKWPDMLVREQTFHAIKDFLITNHAFKTKFLTFLEKQNLESKVLEVLAIIYLVNIEQVNYFLFDEVEEKIKSPSLLSDVCLKEIFQLNSERQSRPWIKNHSGRTLYFFEKDSVNFKIIELVKRNLNLLKKLCKIELNFEEQFYFEYEQIQLKEKNLLNKQLDYFYEPRYEGVPNIKLVRDDIQISAFLRLISYYVDVYNLPIDFALLLSQDFIPVDFGLLELKPSTKPLFINELVDFDFQQWNFQENEFIPVYLSCPIKMDVDSDNKEIVALEIYPVLLDDTSKSLETDFEIFRENIYRQEMKEIPWSINIKKLIIPENIPQNFIGLFYNCYNYIQRLYTVNRELFIPNEKDLKITIENNKLFFKINEQIIGYIQYWYDNYKTFYYKDTTSCTGVITYFHKSYINKINKNDELTILVNYKKFNNNNQDFFELSDNLYYSIKI